VTRLWLLTLKCALIVLLAFVFMETNDPFLMVGGSESTSFLVAPTVPVQIVFLAAFGFVLLIPKMRFSSILSPPLALCMALLGSHRLVIDDLRGEVRDTYLGVTFQKLKIDPNNEGGLVITRSPWCVGIGEAGGKTALRLMSPVWLGLDRAALSSLPHTPPRH
jgi:hypothetical protein